MNVEGYVVITVEGRQVGRISGTDGDFFVVDQGAAPTVRAPLPKRFARIDHESGSVWAGISSRILFSAPKVSPDGVVDDAATNAFYEFDQTV